MDNGRFDLWTRSLATRISRRAALKSGGALAATGAAGVLAAPAHLTVDAKGDTAAFWYTVIRRYRLDGQIEPVRQALMAGFLPLICGANGFRAYLAVEAIDSDERVLVTVTAFSNRSRFEAFARAEADWVAENLGRALPEPEETIAGAAYIRAGVPRRFDSTCPAAPTRPTATPTATSTATASATATTPAATPAPTQTPRATSTPAPTATPGAQTPTPTPAACGSEGCPCTVGALGSCNAPLSCCQDFSAPPGAPGFCQAECPAPPAPTPTPQPPCTSVTCPCDEDVPTFCDEGLVCCQGICFPPDKCL